VKHRNRVYGSMATPCSRCGLAFALQVSHIGWEGQPCRAVPYSISEHIALDKAYVHLILRREAR
jgi:hypothetical protein